MGSVSLMSKEIDRKSLPGAGHDLNTGPSTLEVDTLAPSHQGCLFNQKIILYLHKYDMVPKNYIMFIET